MNRFLLTLFLSLVVCLPAQSGLLSFVTPSFAQDLTPTIISSPQLNPQGNAWDAFLSNLLPGQFKQIPDTLQNINCASLPADACDSIKSASTKKDTISPSSLNPQANDDTTKKEVVSDAAGQYTIGSGVHTPPEVSQASTNIIDSIIFFFRDLPGIFNKGEKEAKNYAGTTFPQDVTDQQFAQGLQNSSGLVSENSNVLGAQAQSAAMDMALPMVQCGALPAGLCGTDNKPNVVQPNVVN